MKIKFSTALLIITFEGDERFAGRKLAIGGEALAWGFDAYPSGMRWAKPYENEKIDEPTQRWLMDKVIEENRESNKKTEMKFKIIVNWK